MADEIIPLEIEPPVPVEPKRLSTVSKPKPSAEKAKPRPGARASSPKPQAGPPPPKWSQIEASPKYQALDNDGRESVRQSFWRDVVSPLVPTAELDAAREEFDRRTKPSLLKRAAVATQQALGGREAPTDLPSLEGEAAPEAPQAEPVAPPPAAAPARLRAQQDMGSAEADWFGDEGVLRNAPAGMVAAGKNAVANMGAMSMEEAARQTEVEQLTGLSPAQRAATYSPRQEALRHRDPLSTEGMPGLPAPGAERNARLRAMIEQARASGEDYKKWAEQTRKDLELITPKGEMSDMQQAVWSVVQSAPPTMMGIAVGIITRNPAAAMAIAGGGGMAFQVGATYGEASQKVGHEFAARAARIDGILEGIGEAIPLRVALRAGSPFVRRLVQTIGEEAGQEGITQFLQDLNAFTSYNPTITLQEAWQNFKVAVLAGAVAGSVYGTAGAVADQRRFVTEAGQKPPAAPPGAPPGAPPRAAPPPAAPPQGPAAAPEDPAEISRMIAGEDPLPAEVMREQSPAAAAAIPAEQALGREEAEEAPGAPPAPPAALPPQTPAPAPIAAPAAPAGAGRSSATTPPVYRVETEDQGEFSIKVIRQKDGSAVLFDESGDVGPVEYNAAFASGKSDEELLRYTYEPLGYKSSTRQEEPAPRPAQRPAAPAATGESAKPTAAAGPTTTAKAPSPAAPSPPPGTREAGAEATTKGEEGWRSWETTNPRGEKDGAIMHRKGDMLIREVPDERTGPTFFAWRAGKTPTSAATELGSTKSLEEAKALFADEPLRKAAQGLNEIFGSEPTATPMAANEQGQVTPIKGEGEVERSLVLPMLDKGPGYRGVPSSEIEIHKVGGRYAYRLSLQTNTSGMGGPVGEPAYDTAEAALEAAIEKGIAWAKRDRNLASASQTAAHARHVKRLIKWLEEQRPKKGGPDAEGDKSPQVRGEVQGEGRDEELLRGVPGRDEAELRDREAPEAGARGPGAGEEAAPAERGGEQVVPQPYASGMSRDRDMRAAIASAAGVGVEIGEVSGPGLKQLADAVAAGKEVFVDSGAFNNYKARKRAEKEGKPPPPPINFDRVLERYLALSGAVRTRLEALKEGKDAGETGLEELKAGLLMFVAPDKVGEQEATLELLEKYGERLRHLADKGGHEIIIPFQRGPVKQSEAYKRVAKIMGGDHFVVGIPSAVEALDDEQLRDLLDPYGNGYHPERIHILGAVAPKKMESRMKVIREIYEDEVPGVTADAMVLRSKLSEVKGLEGEEKFDRIVEILSGSKMAIAAAQEARAAPFELQQEGRLSEQQVATLTDELRKKLLTPHGFKTITEVRAWARDKIGTPIKPGTMAAKQLDEAIEVAIVDAGRTLVKSGREKGRTVKEIYGALTSFYDRQPTLGVRTSTSIRDQAYSTPLPLAFLASRLAGIGDNTTVYEPTAGNGMLLIAADPQLVTANELNPERADALRKQGFATVTQKDATTTKYEPAMDVVIANPPFGYVKDDKGQTRDWKINAEYTTNQIDHAIAMRALEAMKDDGAAVLIVAAPDKLKEGESRQDAYNGKNLRAFYYTLYRDYNVVDQFTVAGDLYAKQGAAWPVDVVVIRGRGKSSLPLPAAQLPRIYKSWGELEEKFDDRHTGRTAEDRRPSEGTARGEPGPAARDEAGVVPPVGGPVGSTARGPGPGRPEQVRGRPVPEQPDRGGRAAPAGTAGVERGERGQPRGVGEPADVAPKVSSTEELEKIFDEEFSKAFGDLEKAPPRGGKRKAASREPGGDEFEALRGELESATGETYDDEAVHEHVAAAGGWGVEQPPEPPKPPRRGRKEPGAEPDPTEPGGELFENLRAELEAATGEPYPDEAVRMHVDAAGGWDAEEQGLLGGPPPRTAGEAATSASEEIPPEPAYRPGDEVRFQYEGQPVRTAVLQQPLNGDVGTSTLWQGKEGDGKLVGISVASIIEKTGRVVEVELTARPADWHHAPPRAAKEQQDLRRTLALQALRTLADRARAEGAPNLANELDAFSTYHKAPAAWLQARIIGRYDELLERAKADPTGTKRISPYPPRKPPTMQERKEKKRREEAQQLLTTLDGLRREAEAQLKMYAAQGKDATKIQERLARLQARMDKVGATLPSYLAKRAAGETVEGIAEIAKGLDELFGTRKGRLGMGMQFDEETYAKAKPHFIAALKHFQTAGRDAREAIGRLIQYMREVLGAAAETINRMRQYAVRFVQDVQAGKIPEMFAEQAPIAAGQETELQVAHVPTSELPGLGTLVPVNMKESIRESMERLRDKVGGSLDDYVATELGYARAHLGRYFGGEQVEALAAAMYAMKNGSGYIIGDQTGIGKGRVVAGIIRYALRNGLVPIFVTERPTLYKDIYRDLADVGMADINPLMTNSALSVPLTEDESVVVRSKSSGEHNALLQALSSGGKLGEYDVIFTTYTQMQTVMGGKRTPRMDFLEAFGRGGVLILDESHNAGGDKQPTTEKARAKKQPTRADFVRGIARLAHSVFYSSATYAKRPEVMDLYFKTDMSLAVDNPAALPAAIRAGGVPLQQIVASMLAKAGQYVRRERSFAGITYNTEVVETNRDMAEAMSSIMRGIADFDYLKAGAVKALRKEVRKEARTMTQDGSIGAAGVTSTNFTSLMHNSIDQMLLALKIVPAARKAIELAKKGEKPVLTVSNTMGSFIDKFVSDNELNPGDAIDVSFGDIMRRYLERSRDVVIGNAFGKKTRHRLSDEELGPMASLAWHEIKKEIDRIDWSGLPLSPIDYAKNQIEKAGFVFGELTGRTNMIDYSGDTPIYRTRPGKELTIRGRNMTITNFNGGDLKEGMSQKKGSVDIILLNRSGATGISLHAHQKVRDQRKRHMILVQPEANVDTHMQMLGRVNRTGQVVEPEYSQLVADIPAEKRPAAVLAKKMASLNANTTASRGSALTSREVVDFMNQYGDEVITQIMEDNPDIHRQLGAPLRASEEGTGLNDENAITRVTGRIPLLTLAKQEELYDLLESEYLALVDEKERTGENALEAKTLPLEAKTKKVVRVSEGKGGDSPFAAGVDAEIADVKRLGKPYTSEELLALLRSELEAPETASLYELRSLGNTKSNAIRDQLDTDFKAFRDRQLALVDDERKAEAQRTRLEAQHTHVDSVLAKSQIGRQVTLRTKYGNLAGVVTKIALKGKPDNPAARGSWRITFALADAVRHLTLPASRLTPHGDAQGIDAGLVAIEDYDRNLYEGKQILQLFDEAQSVSREDRVIMTGNLLTAYSKFPHGRIINYTTDEGRVRQGILMPLKFDLDKALNAMPVEFPNARTAIEFLEHMNGQPVVESVEEKLFRVAKLFGEDNYRISVAAARDKGGIVYLNPAVLEAAGGDFVKTGNSMRVELSKEKAIATLQVILDTLTQRVHTNAYRQEAKEFLSRNAPPVVRMAARQGLHESKWLPQEDIERRVREITKGIPNLPYIGIIDRPNDVFEDNRIHDWVQGFTVNQKVYLARSGLENLDEVEATLWHELFHYGVRRFMTREQYIAAMNRLYNSNAWISSRANDWLATAEGKVVRAENGLAYARARAVDEALANLSERLQGMTEEEAFAKASPLDNAIMAIVRWAADIAERFGATRMAARLRGYTNEEAIRFVTRIFSRLKMNEASVSGPGSYEDVSFMQLSPQAHQRRREERARRLAKDTGLGDKIIAAPFKLVKWDAMAVVGWEKVRELNERATEAYPAWETIRAGVESDYGLEEQYLDRRVQMQAHLQKWARGAKNLLDKLGLMTREESRVAYEWMHDRDADHLIEGLPEESKVTLRSIKELIRSLGEEAVRLGQLSREVFERNELAYLHRSYEKHEIEKTIMARLGNRKAIAVWAEQYKGRGLKDWRTMAVLNAMAREPLDPRTMKGRKFHRLELRARVPENALSTLERMSGSRPLGKLRKVIYWPDGKAIPVEYAGWHNDGLWEVRWNMGGKWGLWRDLSKAEREHLGEIDEVRFGVAKTLHLMTHDIEIGQMQEWIAQNYAKDSLEPYEKPYERSAKESLASTYGKLTWVKVPSTEIRGTNVKKYGALAGKYVPGPIWNDIRQHVSLDSERGALRRMWDDMLRMWKISKTALSPGVHMNNIMANVFIADFHDVRAKDLLKAIKVMLDAKRANGDPDNKALYERFEDSGALHGMFKYHELKAEVLDPLLEDIRRQSLNDESGAMVRTLSIISWLNGLEKGGRRTIDMMVDAYGAEDEVFRLAAFIKALRNGFTDIEAGRISRKAFLDYDINAPWIQALRRTAFPFIAFPYRAIPMMIDTFTHKPWKLIKYVAVAALLDEFAYAWLGLDDEDEERERRLLADEKSGRIWGIFPKMIRMPWNREGNPVFLDVRRWFPSGDIFDVEGTHAVIPLSPAVIPGGPMALIAELVFNKAAFTGQDIRLETDTGWEVAGKLGMHLYRFAMPNLFMIPGTWSFEGIRGAAGLGPAGPQTDVFGREFSLPQSLANAIGVKLGTYPEDVLRYNLMRKTDAQSREILGNIYKAVGDKARNKQTDEDLREYVRGQVEKLKKLHGETAKKVRPPEP